MWDTIPLFPDNGKSKDKAIATKRGPRMSTSTLTTVGGGTSLVSGSSELGASGPLTNIPEFNDCQKFVIPRTTTMLPALRGIQEPARYDSLYAIFAAFKLDSVVNELHGMEITTWMSSNAAVATVSADGVITGIAAGTAVVTATSTVNPARQKAVLIAVVAAPTHPSTKVSITPPPLIAIGQVDTLVTELGPPTTSTLPVAEVYTYGPGYEPLHIGANFNCLYLYYDDAGALRAKMVPIPHLDASVDACFGAADPKSAAVPVLSVVRTPNHYTGAVPPVARWDFDRVNGQQYVGIKCGDAWCEIGSAGRAPFTPSNGFVAASSASPGEARVLGVKGWYDQQYLAVEQDVGHAVPSFILGTVIPDPDLASRDSASFVSRWVRVAFVGLETTNATPGDVAHYKTKFNFDAVPVSSSSSGKSAMLSTLSQMSLCYGERQSCGVQTPTPPKGCGPDFDSLGPIRRWWVKIAAPSSTAPMYRCVTRRDHSHPPMGVKFVATARWRWLALDETVWDYCAAAGCCESDGDARSPGWPP